MARYLAWPAERVDATAIVVIHEIFGVTDWIKGVVDRFAARGYLAMAPDLFTGPIHPEFTPAVAERMMPVVWALPAEQKATPKALRAALKGYSKVDMEVAVALGSLNLNLEWIPAMVANLRAAVGYLARLPGSSGKVASVGFCFGGRMSFELAAAEPSLSAAVVFYGIAPKEEALGQVRCPVLGLYGALDEYVTKDVPRAARTMERHGKSFEYEVFDRTGHAFARPGSKHYHEGNAAKAWERTDAFLAKHLGPPR